MTNTAASFSAMIKHVWLEPKRKAQMEWFIESAKHCPAPMDQILAQVGRHAAEQFVAGNGWPDPNQRVTVVDDRSNPWHWRNEPHWDWWEPRHDNPSRRQNHRNANFHNTT